ncbi:hypothetical protein RCO48_06395 [Peribacillus frigoritolerans]|nr:hypothetical protein [Peribacillus frigoritolerans]
MERKVQTPAGKAVSGETPQESRGGSPTARGKRVPEVEINVPIVQAIKIDKLDFHRVCLQSEGRPEGRPEGPSFFLHFAFP